MVWKIVLNVKSKIPTQATTKIKLKLVKHLDWYNMPNPDHTSVTLLQSLNCDSKLIFDSTIV